MKAQNKFSELPSTGFIRQYYLLHHIPFSAATLWRKVKDGSFPAPYRISSRVTAWRVEDIREWMQSFSQTSQ